jgi:hypothetical protein
LEASRTGLVFKPLAEDLQSRLDGTWYLSPPEVPFPAVSYIRLQDDHLVVCWTPSMVSVPAVRRGCCRVSPRVLHRN